MPNIPHWKQDQIEEESTPDYPAVSPALVEVLEGLYPDRCPAPDTSDRDIWRAVGRAEVVRFLRELSNRVPTSKET
jgi:hypothetical protein